MAKEKTMGTPFPPGFHPRRLFLNNGDDYSNYNFHWSESTEWGRRNRLFALVEGAAVLPRTRRLFGPGGEPIDSWQLVSKRVLEVRLCGFNANRFLATMGEFEDLSEGVPSSTQRENRRIMLNQLYESDATPGLHLYIADSERIFEADVRYSLFAPGQWLEIEMSPLPASKPAPIVFLDQPLTAGSGNVPLALTAINLIPIEVVRKLRDIFSLAHVPDADFTERENGAGPGTPIIPPKLPAPTQQAQTPTVPIISDSQVLDASGGRLGEVSAS
jgi:hypothetical protein